MRYGWTSVRTGMRTVRNKQIRFNNRIWECDKSGQIDGKRIRAIEYTHYSEWIRGVVSEHELFISGNNIPASCCRWKLCN